MSQCWMHVDGIKMRLDWGFLFLDRSAYHVLTSGSCDWQYDSFHLYYPYLKIVHLSALHCYWPLWDRVIQLEWPNIILTFVSANQPDQLSNQSGTSVVTGESLSLSLSLSHLFSPDLSIIITNPTQLHTSSSSAHENIIIVVLEKWDPSCLFHIVLACTAVLHNWMTRIWTTVQ